MSRRPAALLLLSLALAAPSRAAQVTLSASASTVTVGEHGERRVAARAGPGAERMVVRAAPGCLLPGGEACEILSRRALPPAAASPGRAFEEILTVAFFRTGDFTVGPFAADFLPAGSEEGGVSGRLVIRVRSLLGEEDRDIQPLKEPLPLPGHPRHLFPYAAALLALLLLAALAAFLLRRRRRPAASPPLPPPEEELATALQLLRQQGPAAGDPRPFFVALSALVKRFSRRAYGFNAEDCTTAETAAQLAEREDAAALVAVLRSVLDLSDLVKFARREPATAEVAALWPALDAVIERHRARRRAQETDRAQAGR